MMHKTRRWRISTCESSAELSRKLTQHTWTPCTGFALQGWLFLNDATSPDGAQEYAVVRLDSDGHHRQYDSVTFGWMTAAEALDWLTEFLAGREPCASRELGPVVVVVLSSGAFGQMRPKIVEVREHAPGTCSWCA